MWGPLGKPSPVSLDRVPRAPPLIPQHGTNLSNLINQHLIRPGLRQPASSSRSGHCYAVATRVVQCVGGFAPHTLQLSQEFKASQELEPVQAWNYLQSF